MPLLGAIFGSFANVIIVRWPSEENIVIPRSKCRSCDKQILNIDNIPIISWLLLKGKCRFCKSKISTMYPIVELLMALLFLAVYLTTGLSITGVEYLIFVFGLLTISVIDLKHFLIPDILSISGILIGVLGALINPERMILDSFFGIVLGGGIFWITGFMYHMIKKEHGLGGGDIKLLAWIGAVLGWQSIPFIIMFSSIVGTFIGVIVMFKTKGGMKTVLPFGPFLALASCVYLFVGKQITAWYWEVFFP